MDLKKLGTIIRNKREAIGISSSILAEKSGIRRPTLWIIERGENPKTGKPSRPAKDKLERLAEVLHMNQTETEELLSLADYTYTNFPHDNLNHVSYREQTGLLQQVTPPSNVSLTVSDGTVYALKDNYLHAIDTKTGHRLWSASLDALPLKSGQVPVEEKQFSLHQQGQHHQPSKNGKGLLFVLSGITGNENKNVIDGVKKDMGGIFESQIFTTREPLLAEGLGEPHFFISQEEFKDYIAKDMLLTYQYNETKQAWYGHLRYPITHSLTWGKDIIMDAGPEEAVMLRREKSDAILILLTLLPRHVRTEEENRWWEERIQQIKDEYQVEYDYFVTYEIGNLEKAVDELSSIISNEREKKRDERMESEQPKSQMSDEVSD